MSIALDVIFGAEVLQSDLVNLYGCRIGADSRIGPFVEVQWGVVVGRKCRISSHGFICEGVETGDEVFNTAEPVFLAAVTVLYVVEAPR